MENQQKKSKPVNASKVPTLIFKEKFGFRRILESDHEAVLDCFLQGYQSNQLFSSAGVPNEELIPYNKENIELCASHPLSFLIVDIEKQGKVIGVLLCNDFTDENGQVLYGKTEEEEEENANTNENMSSFDLVKNIYKDLIKKVSLSGKLKKQATATRLSILPEYQRQQIMFYCWSFGELLTIYHQRYVTYFFISTNKVDVFKNKYVPFKMIEQIDAESIEYKGKKIFAGKSEVNINISEVIFDPRKLRLGKLLQKEFTQYISQQILQEGFHSYFFQQQLPDYKPGL